MPVSGDLVTADIIGNTVQFKHAVCNAVGIPPDRDTDGGGVLLILYQRGVTEDNVGILNHQRGHRGTVGDKRNGDTVGVRQRQQQHLVTARQRSVMRFLKHRDRLLNITLSIDAQQGVCQSFA